MGWLGIEMLLGLRLMAMEGQLILLFGAVLWWRAVVGVFTLQIMWGEALGACSREWSFIEMPRTKQSSSEFLTD